MTCHATPKHRATDKHHDQLYQKQGFWCEHPPRSSILDEPLPGPTAHLAPLAPSLSENTNTEPDDLIATLVRDQLNYMEALKFLGFGHETSASILRCWIALKLDAPAGGPYDLLGIALAAIAELGENDMRDCHCDVVGCGNTPPRSEWQFAFAEILNYEALAAVQRVGAYLAPDFTKAKWLVYHMVLRRWRELVGRTI
ncbi:hypothetical protein E0Z10_g2110 [Xylaria hypoxylon]|uniref:Uncharacterized protein n=1 Tax=Xylaria hypoxylon TaxID=37992 RepID=A0A4Z0Z529_9PEZI|nr:hypothetical protein E0Z10_g2110 [Xylaria hypoxylon]